jgi:DNA-binding YbaB/EbfC family protein
MGLDLQQLMLQAQQMQDGMARAQRELAESEVTGSAGGGMVTATLTGSGELVGLEIKPEAVDPDDTETLADLIIAAVRDARHEVDQLSEQLMSPVTGGLGQLAGGLGLSGMPGMPGLPGLPEMPGRPGLPG